jgi:predicted DsbA family dithiol-disulfide isomerase
VGRAEGIRLAFEKIWRTPNTLDVHRLIQLADLEGVQEAVMAGLTSPRAETSATC